jgi:hypothetical protein
MTEQASLAPFTLFEYAHRPGTFCLMLSDGEMEKVEAVFEAYGAEGNGHGWGGLAESLAQSQMPGIASQLTFDSEAGMFAVVSRDRGTLERLGAKLHAAFHDHALLGQLIREADPVLLPHTDAGAA